MSSIKPEKGSPDAAIRKMIIQCVSHMCSMLLVTSLYSTVCVRTTGLC